MRNTAKTAKTGELPARILDLLIADRIEKGFTPEEAEIVVPLRFMINKQLADLKNILYKIKELGNG